LTPFRQANGGLHIRQRRRIIPAPAGVLRRLFVFRLEDEADQAALAANAALNALEPIQ